MGAVERSLWPLSEETVHWVRPGDHVAAWGATGLDVSVLHQSRVWVHPDGEVLSPGALSMGERLSVAAWLERLAPYFYEQELRRRGLLTSWTGAVALPAELFADATGWVRGTELSRHLVGEV